MMARQIDSSLFVTFVCMQIVLILPNVHSQQEIKDEYGPVCRNELNEPIDWFIVYKIPDKPVFFLKKGRGYAFMEGKSLVDYKESDDESSEVPIRSTRTIDDPLSIVSRTLKPIFQDDFNSSSINYLMYNDQPPAGGPKPNDVRAHSKGVVIMDWQTQTGSWLIHSVPRYPKQRLSNEPLAYPESGLKYGQLFMCVSFDLENASKFVERHLDVIKPIIYDSELSEIFLLRYPAFAKLTKEHSAKTIKALKRNDSIRLHQTFQTLAGEEIDVFSKSRAFKRDIYNKWLMDYFHQSIAVESWRFGPSSTSLNSTCDDQTPLRTLNIDYLHLKDSQNKSALVQWKHTNDHSKWAIGIDQNKPLVCVGDINRMQSQFNRGGGVVCMKNLKAWKKMISFVDKTEKCQNESAETHQSIEITETNKLSNHEGAAITEIRK